MTFKEKYHKYLASDTWVQIKIDLLQDRGCKCERCGCRRAPQFLHVHHVTYDRVFHEEPSDLEVLCSKCHVVEHEIVTLRPKKKDRKVIPKDLKQEIKILTKQMKLKQISCEEYVDRVKAIREPLRKYKRYKAA